MCSTPKGFTPHEQPSRPPFSRSPSFRPSSSAFPPSTGALLPSSLSATHHLLPSARPPVVARCPLLLRPTPPPIVCLLPRKPLIRWRPNSFLIVRSPPPAVCCSPCRCTCLITARCWSAYYPTPPSALPDARPLPTRFVGWHLSLTCYVTRRLRALHTGA
jgi:hypothetical protein